jgi:lysine 2,3-aminomutase
MATLISPWRHIQRQNITSWEALTSFLEWDAPLSEQISKNPRFSLNLPLRLAQKISKNTLNDPILRQFLPTPQEEIKSLGFVSDPVGDTPSRKSPKLLHKYQGRALLVTTSACAMHCRYCFRQNFPYETQEKGFAPELELIRQDPSISEILLSGGDPLSLSNDTLRSLLSELATIPHLKRLRFHTRFPIGIPERIDTTFLEILKESPLQIYFVIHCNHANELDTDIFHALKQIQQLGIPVLNQSVLLKDVNDSVDALTTLCQALIDNGILPYYLHQLDRVEGAAHFEVPEAKGKALIQALSAHLPGYAIPKYVREIAGMPSKTPI